MRRSETGSFVVLFLPVAVALVCGTIFVLNLGRALAERDRADTVADAAVLSALRIRSTALSTVARRWEETGRLLGPVRGGGVVQLPLDQWSVVQRGFDDVRRSLSGYRGRIRSVMTVVAEAQGVPRTALEILDDEAVELGIQPEALVVVDESGHQMTLVSGWLKRTWRLSEDGHPDGEASRRLRTRTAPIPDPSGLASAWNLSGAATASLEWPVPETTRRSSHGGYPETWDQAVSGGRLDPYGEAVFRARLGSAR